MRIPIVAGNWKMNTTVNEAEILVYTMLEKLEQIDGVEKVLCPPFVSLVAINIMLQNSSISLGAQNMHFENKGAYTGEISPPMLSELCEYVILGHSERRWYFGETDGIINKKIKAAFTNKLTPILCVGERLEDNEAGKTEEIIGKQLRAALNGTEPVSDLVLAYEPVWAIGTGKAASNEQATATIGFIRNLLAELWNKGIAQDLRIIYGGSVTNTNIAELISQKEIDGVLVGGASLKAEEFLSIVDQTAAIKRNIQ